MTPLQICEAIQYSQIAIAVVAAASAAVFVIRRSRQSIGRQVSSSFVSSR